MHVIPTSDSSRIQLLDGLAYRGDTYKSKSLRFGSALLALTNIHIPIGLDSVPAAVVPGGTRKAIVVGVLMSGNTVSVGGSSPHVYHAIDSTMGPKMDLSIQVSL